METINKRLTAEDREVISQMLVQQYSCSAIARVLQKHRSAITREVASGVYHSGKYSAVRSQQKAVKRASSRHQQRKLDNPALWKFVREKLTLRWSPEQIAQEMNVLAASREVSCHASVRWHPDPGFRLSPE